MSAGPFSRRTVAWLSIIASVSLACALLLSVFAEDLGGPPLTAEPSAYSKSAIGHAGLVALLERLNIPVVVSQHDSGRKAGASAVLVVAEPHVGEDLAERLGVMLAQAETVLVVLPKWEGEPDLVNPGRLAQAMRMPESEVAPVLAALGVEGSVIRPAHAAGPWTWTSPFGEPTLQAPQLVISDELEPVVSAAAGMLLGSFETEHGTVWVLSDPDVLSNHGLGRGNNAVLAVNLLDELRRGEGVVVIDETLHGFQSEPSIWRELFEFPLILPTIQVLLVVLVLVWSAAARFGAPLPAVPAIAPGKAFLIENTASLLHHGGHGGHILQRFLHNTVRDVGRALHAPTHLGPAELETWLGRIATARKVTVDLGAVTADVAALAQVRPRPGDGQHTRRLVDAASKLYRWRQEMIHGPSDRQAH